MGRRIAAAAPNPRRDGVSAGLERRRQFKYRQTHIKKERRPGMRRQRNRSHLYKIRVWLPKDGNQVEQDTDSTQAAGAYVSDAHTNFTLIEFVST